MPWRATRCNAHLYLPWTLTAEGYALTHANMAMLPSRAEPWPYMSGADITVT